MDLSHFTPDQLNQLRALLQAGAPPVSSPAAQVAPPAPSFPVSQPLPATQPFPVTQTLAPPAAQVIPQPAPPPPITQIYTPHAQSAVGYSVPALPMVAQAGAGLFQPFLGAPGLSVNLAAGHANQARVASYSSQPSRGAGLPTRGSREPRGGGGRRPGPAQRPPSLPQTGPDRAACLATNTAVPTIHITAKVLPPLQDIDRPTEPIAYRFLRSTVNAFLQENHLIFHLDLPVAFLIDDLVKQIAMNMQHSPLQYAFAPPGSGGLTLTEHEGLPLQLLAYKGRGLVRGANPNVKLIAYPYTPTTTIGEVYSNRTKFAVADAFENNRFVLNFIVASAPLSAVFLQQRHTCVAKRFYRIFPGDTQADYGQGYFSETSGGEDSDDGGAEMTDAEDDLVVLPPASQPLPIALPPAQQVQPALATVSNQAPRRLQRRDESFWATESFLPKAIWDAVWAPPAGEAVYKASTLAEQVFDAANLGNAEVMKFDVEASSTQEMASLIESRISQAIDDRDFSHILSPNRGFYIVDSHGDHVSFGPGIEREAFYNIFEKFRYDENNEWLSYHRDAPALATIKSTHSIITHHFVPSKRIKDLKKFGAICALLLVIGQCPAPIDPCILQYAVHNGNLEAIHPSFLGEWHPKLRAQILAWKQLGPTGDTSDFNSLIKEVLGFEGSALEQRTEQLHAALAAGLLYHSLFGPQPPFHPEWQAFFAGFSLPCQNGFSFLSVPKAFEGGPEVFFSLSWTSQIQNYQSLAPFLTFSSPFIHVITELNATLARAGSSSVRDHIGRFLQGVGVPCPQYFASLDLFLSPVIDMSQANTASFRPRMFAWAATGSPFVATDADAINIEIVDERDHFYAGNSLANRSLMMEGVISFKTCMRTVKIPAPFINAMAKKSYPSTNIPGGPESFAQALDHWLFCQILVAIGMHTIV